MLLEKLAETDNKVPAAAGLAAGIGGTIGAQKLMGKYPKAIPTAKKKIVGAAKLVKGKASDVKGVAQRKLRRAGKTVGERAGSIKSHVLKIVKRLKAR